MKVNNDANITVSLTQQKL